MGLETVGLQYLKLKILSIQTDLTRIPSITDGGLLGFVDR